jgi:hypothetical protein
MHASLACSRIVALGSSYSQPLNGTRRAICQIHFSLVLGHHQRRQGSDSRRDGPCTVCAPVVGQQCCSQALLWRTAQQGLHPISWGSLSGRVGGRCCRRLRPSQRPTLLSGFGQTGPIVSYFAARKERHDSWCARVLDCAFGSEDAGQNRPSLCDFLPSVFNTIASGNASASGSDAPRPASTDRTQTGSPLSRPPLTVAAPSILPGRHQGLAASPLGRRHRSLQITRRRVKAPKFDVTTTDEPPSRHDTTSRFKKRQKGGNSTRPSPWLARRIFSSMAATETATQAGPASHPLTSRD